MQRAELAEARYHTKETSKEDGSLGLLLDSFSVEMRRAFQETTAKQLKTLPYLSKPLRRYFEEHELLVPLTEVYEHPDAIRDRLESLDFISSQHNYSQEMRFFSFISRNLYENMKSFCEISNKKMCLALWASSTNREWMHFGVVLMRS